MYCLLNVDLTEECLNILKKCGFDLKFMGNSCLVNYYQYSDALEIISKYSKPKKLINSKCI